MNTVGMLLPLFSLFIASTNAADPLDRTKLATPVVLDLRAEPGATYVRSVVDVLDSQLSVADRRRLGNKVLSARRVSIVEGSFGERGAIVVVDIELRPKSPDVPPKFISGMFTLTSSGALGQTIVAPRMQETRFVLTGIGDADGDGLDDLRYTATTPDGVVEHLVHWEGGKPVDVSDASS